MKVFLQFENLGIPNQECAHAVVECELEILPLVGHYVDALDVLDIDEYKKLEKHSLQWTSRLAYITRIVLSGNPTNGMEYTIHCICEDINYLKDPSISGY
jgi:hypothetical protein